MSAVTEITNIVGDLETYADELGAEGWYNAANACRYAGAEIERLCEGRDTMGNLWAKEKEDNERLLDAVREARAALSDIADYDDCPRSCIRWAQIRAKRALENLDARLKALEGK